MEIYTTKDRLQRLAHAVNKLRLIEEAKVYEDSLIDYVEYMWPVVEPATPFVRGWVVEAICEHLQAVTSGQLQRLLINVFPGATKSLITDVFWPSWEWGPKNMPHLRYVCASYAQHLTERDNMRCRNVVVSDRYKKYWGDRFKISNEQFTKVKFANDKTGWKFATSPGGVGQGERGDRFLIDDPNNPTEVESDIVRRSTELWFTEVVPDRLNDMQKSSIVVIMQRVHEDDVSGIILTKELGYEHLCIPIEYDSARHCTTSIGWSDPRTEDGELAWPERFPAQVVEMLKKKGRYAFASQYLQTPEPRGGGIIKRDWWKTWDKEAAAINGVVLPDPDSKGNVVLKYPRLQYVVASLDTAYGMKEENDYSAMTVWGTWIDHTGTTKIMLMYAWYDRLEIHDLVRKTAASCKRFLVDKVLIEGKASGKSVIQELRRMYGEASDIAVEALKIKGYTGWGIEEIQPERDKISRVHAITHLFEDGMIYAPDADWADDVINNMAVFPRGSHDDLVDSASQALRHLRQIGLAVRRSEYLLDEREETRYKKRLTPLYGM